MNPYIDGNGNEEDFNNPFENDFNKENNNQNNQFNNPYESNNFQNNENNNDEEDHYMNPFANETKEQNDKTSGNPFEEHNENNPFENDFQQSKMPLFEDFEKSVSNPYINENFNNKNQNNDNNQFNNNNNNNNFNDKNNFNGSSNYDFQNGNSYINNFGGPINSQNQNNMCNPFQTFGNNNVNPNPQHQPISADNNSKEEITIKKMISTCQNYYQKGSELFENYQIKDAIIKLISAIKGLDGLKETIKTKLTNYTNYLPEIESLRKKIYSTVQQYRLMLYQLIPLKFRAVPYNPNDNLFEFSKRYVLTNPFITFDDIYDGTGEERNIKASLLDNYNRAQRTNHKNLLIYGPRGSGKTLAVHALANNIGAKIAQIEGLELFQIPYFVKEFIKAAFEIQQTKPLIVYVRNLDTIYKAINAFNFLFDKVSSSIGNVLFVASTCVPIEYLPKDISKKFYYIYCIRPALHNQKGELLEFLIKKLGIKINMGNEELKAFANSNFRTHSNNDLFNVLKTAIDSKKENYPKEDQDNIYNDGLDINDLMKAIDAVPGSMNSNVMKAYYL